jgi:uncharacterized protein DUF5916/cellulose/xylan binding protein with CBM9 domain
MRRIPSWAAATLLATVCGPVPGIAQQTIEQTPGPAGKNRFTVEPAASPVTVDGVLDEAAWSTATVIPLTHEWSPGDNIEPPVKTECLVTFDGDNLYVAFRAFDPDPSQIRAYLADRDTPFDNDTVGFLVDTFNDRRRAFEFRVNALGVQMEATLSDIDALEDWSWDAIWDSAGRVTGEGYVVEMAVPFKQLRFPRASGVQTWGFLATRDYPRSLAHQIRSTRIERGQNCQVCQFDTLTGLRHLEPGYNVEAVPTVTARRTDERPALDQPLASGQEDAEAGLTLRWGITPNISLNAALNPDFSQVEADVAQLSVNTRFALFFPEKRPFFLEGADYFATPYQAVFTRTVADPRAGLKVTGKEGKNAFGVFFAQDRINNLIFPGNESSEFLSEDRDVTSGVVRYRRDVGATSTLGFLYAGREGDGYFNHVAGIDGSLRLADADTVRFQVLSTDTEYPANVASAFGQPRGSFRGIGWRIDYNHATRDWLWAAGYNSLDPEFRADSGFIPRVDIRHASGYISRIVRGEPGDWYSRLDWYAGADVIENHDGKTTDMSGDFDVTYQGPKQTLFLVGLRPNRETFNGVTYDNFRQDMRFNIRPSGNLGLGFYVRRGPVIDFVNARRVDFYHLEPYMDFQLGRRFSGDLRNVYEVFNVKGGRFLAASLTQGTFLFHLNQRTFVRAILQYLDVHRRVSLYDDPEGTEPKDQELFSQLLFSYKLNPQTVLLVGYSDNYEDSRQIDLTQRDRTFFLKIGYAWLW